MSVREREREKEKREREREGIRGSSEILSI